MNRKTSRAEKITLLTKIVEGKVRREDISQLLRSYGPGAVVIFYKKGEENPGPDDEVNFHHKGQEVVMPFRDIQSFTHYDPLTIFLLPRKDSITELR